MAVFIAVPLLVLGVWVLIKVMFDPSDYRLPDIRDVLSYVTRENSQGERNGVFLLKGMRTTAVEAVVGFAVAVIAGFLVGTLIAYRPRIGRGVLPLVVASQTVPIIALAPPLLVWLGTDWKTKTFIAAYIAFFPVVIFTVRGLTSTKRELGRLMNSYAASSWQTFAKVKLPAATPAIFTGLRTAAALSVIGAIVAELPVGASTGIGRITYDAAQYYLFDPPALWASTLAAFALGALFFVGVVTVEKIITKRLGGLR